MSGNGQAGDRIGQELSRNHSTLWIVPSVCVTLQGCAKWCACGCEKFVLALVD